MVTEAAIPSSGCQERLEKAEEKKKESLQLEKQRRNKNPHVEPERCESGGE